LTASPEQMVELAKGQLHKTIRAHKKQASLDY
jgi:hypothetical protein